MEQSLGFLRNIDPAGLWNFLLQMDPNKDLTTVAELRSKLASMKLDPKTDTIQSLVLRLNNLRVKLSMTSRLITEEDVKEQLIVSLPKDNSIWSTARSQALNMGRSLAETITYLQSCESNISYTQPPQPKSANIARSSYRKRGRGTYQRGRNTTHSDCRDQARGELNRKGKQRGTATDEKGCFFCGRKGHVERDCRLEQSQSRAAKERNKARGDANTHFFQDRNINEFDLPYLSYHLEQSNKGCSEHNLDEKLSLLEMKSTRSKCRQCNTNSENIQSLINSWINILLISAQFLNFTGTAFPTVTKYALLNKPKETLTIVTVPI